MKDKNHQHKHTPQEPQPAAGRSVKSLAGKWDAWIHELPNLLLANLYAIISLVVVWAALVFNEQALLFRVNELSVFLYDDLFYEEMMSAPAGFLSYIASYLVQFFHNPVMGATIYVLLLFLVYWLTYKVFDISRKLRPLAMIPVAALLASNTQLGYWIFYLKVPGFYYVALVGVIFSLLAAWVVKKSHIYLKPVLVAAWMYFAYPYFGVYAIVSGVVIAVHSLCLSLGNNRTWQKIVFSSATVVVSAVMYHHVPESYYADYTTVPRDEMLTAGLPVSQWKGDHIPDNEEKENVVSVIRGVNGKVGYPVDRELTKFKLNIDASFSNKAIRSAKDDLFASENINRPLDGKRYTFTFVGKDGAEYYLRQVGDSITLAVRNGKIPQAGQFVCESESDVKEFVAFKTNTGKYLVWDVAQGQDGLMYSVGLASSKSEGHTRCAVMKMKSGVEDKSQLFGLVNLLVFDSNAVLSKDIQPLFVAGYGDGVIKGGQTPSFSDGHTSALRVEEVGFKPAPFSLSMTDRSMWYNVEIYWLPFWLLLVAYGILAITPLFTFMTPRQTMVAKYLPYAVSVVVAALLAVFSYFFWYDNENFRIENEQNKAMWDEDWKLVAKLAKETDEPTRQVVMNKNIALLKLGRSGDKLFTFPEGSADIEAPIPVRLAQTGGKMAYYQYGKFNFCYRWCVEDAVEYGWRVEYLKHAVRSMLLAGEYRLAERYINILKRTKYYADWANDMEKYINSPGLLEKKKEFAMPLEMSCYDDALDVDESYVEAYLTKNLTNIPEEMSRTYADAALVSALTRKDSRAFWSLLEYYVNNFYMDAPSSKKLPVHYQEAVLLFMNLDKGKTQLPQAFLDRFVSRGVEAKMKSFMSLVSQHKGKNEEQMAPYFKPDFGNTYFYFYFFVRNIKTN